MFKNSKFRLLMHVFKEFKPNKAVESLKSQETKKPNCLGYFYY
jgi:hypothetical protein